MKKITAISTISIFLSLLIAFFKNGFVNIITGNNFSESMTITFLSLLIILSLVFLVWGVLLLNNVIQY